MTIEGRVAVVTGGARGIGAAVARQLASAGAVVVVADLQEDAAQKVAEELGGEAAGLALDVRSWSGVARAVESVSQRWGRIDALVNCAGISRVVRSEELEPAVWDDVVDVNLTGTWRCCQLFGRHMLERRTGAIVNIASAYAEIGAPGRVAYAATKTGVVGLTRVLATEWAARGVRVNAVEPGYIETPMVAATFQGGLVSRADLVGRIPAGRLGEAAEVAATVAFLISDGASYITGTAIRVDGGHLAYGGIPAASQLPASL